MHTSQLTRPQVDDPGLRAGVFAGFLVCDKGGAAARADDLPRWLRLLHPSGCDRHCRERGQAVADEQTG